MTMRLVHLSDLHFGTETTSVVDSLAASIRQLGPDLVVISGDFTQKATHSEFAEARRFMDALEKPVFCVPGNHDLPGFSLWQRLTQPYARYRRHITNDLSPIFETDNMLLIGLNSTRAVMPHWNWANGALSAEQRSCIAEKVKGKEHKWLLATFHHPIHKADQMPIDVVVFGGHKMMESLKESGIDLVMTGHVHHASIDAYGDDTHKTVYLSASTALSSRIRHQENGFNVIQLDEHEMKIDIFKLQNGAFAGMETYIQRRY